jgi:hypothetical protein
MPMTVVVAMGDLRRRHDHTKARTDLNRDLGLNQLHAISMTVSRTNPQSA